MRYLYFAALAFMLSLPAAAQDFDKGKAALDRGDYATAQKELRPLAEQGDAWAKDNVQAYMWLSLAAGHGAETAAKFGEIVKSKLTPDQIAAAQRLAREWREKHGN